MRETGEGDVRTKRDKVWRGKFKQEQKKMDSTPGYSRVVPYPSTKPAQSALTSVFG